MYVVYTILYVVYKYLPSSSRLNVAAVDAVVLVALVAGIVAALDALFFRFCSSSFFQSGIFCDSGENDGDVIVIVDAAVVVDIVVV